MALAPNVPVAPVAGAVKVTFTPVRVLPKASVTRTASAVPNAVEMVAVWGEPETRVSRAGPPAVLVRENVVVAAPLVAVTV